MSHTISINDFKGYSKEINIVVDPITGKRIVFVLMADLSPNNTIELYNQIHVHDMFDKIVYTGNHLSLAIKAYNQL